MSLPFSCAPVDFNLAADTKRHCHRCYEAIWPLVEPPQGSVSTKTRQDFVEELYKACLENSGPGRKAVSSVQSTWFEVLHAAFTFTDSGRVTKQNWLDGLSAVMSANEIECVPGSHCSRITSRRVVRLVGRSISMRVMTGRPGSLKRAAMEVESAAREAAKRLAMDFGCEIPFTKVPAVVAEGFLAQEGVLAKRKGSRKVLEHYHVARLCLERSIGEPLCDLLLMLVLTLSASSVTPTVGEDSKEFEAAVARKEPGLFAAGLATRMLWFLHREAFPWEQDSGMVLRVSEMTKKLEHKGSNNRMLLKLGWVVSSSRRENPRNSDLQLREVEELMRVRRELLSLRGDARGFIRQVFSSYNQVWVERCSGVTKEVDNREKRRKRR